MASSPEYPAAAAPRWERVARDPEFQRLVSARRRFVVVMMVFASVNLALYIVLVSWAADFMASTITDGLSVGYLISIAEIVLVCVLAGIYIRKAGRDWDPMLQRLLETAGAESEEDAEATGSGDQGR